MQHYPTFIHHIYINLSSLLFKSKSVVYFKKESKDTNTNEDHAGRRNMSQFSFLLRFCGYIEINARSYSTLLCA